MHSDISDIYIDLSRFEILIDYHIFCAKHWFTFSTAGLGIIYFCKLCISFIWVNSFSIYQSHSKFIILPIVLYVFKYTKYHRKCLCLGPNTNGRQYICKWSFDGIVMVIAIKLYQGHRGDLTKCISSLSFLCRHVLLLVLKLLYVEIHSPDFLFQILLILFFPNITLMYSDDFSIVWWCVISTEP